MDKIDAIRTFVDVAASGSFTRTADKLKISRVKASRHISTLEDWLKVRLLHRTTRRVSLTGQGIKALKSCEQILHHAARMELGLGQNPDRLEGHIRIGCPIGFGQKDLVDAVAEFTALHPSVHIQIIESDNYDQLVDQRIDVALRIISRPDEHLIARKLRTLEFDICASPSCLDSALPLHHPRDLQHWNCLRHEDSSSWSFIFEGNVFMVNVSGNLIINDTVSIFNAALKGMGIARLPRDLTSPYIDNGKLIPLFQNYKMPAIGLWAVYLSRNYQQPVVRSFLDYLANLWRD